MSNKDTDYSVYLKEDNFGESASKSGQTSKNASKRTNKKGSEKAKGTIGSRFKNFWTRKDNKKQKIIAIVCILILLILLLAGCYAWSKLSLIDTNNEDDFVSDDYESDIDLSGMDSITDANSLNDLLMKWATNGGDKMSSKHVKNVLLIGKDSESSLADSMILVSLNEKTEQITLVSFYRDCYIYIQPEGKKPYFGKLNSAYSRGGAKCLMETIENNFKVEIDDYVMVDYTSFPKVIDALGGVDVNVTSKEANYLNATWQNWSLTDTPVKYTAGINHLNGEKALMFCRIRKLDSDVGRTERQRRVITSIISSFKSAGVSKINAAVNALFPNVKTSMSRTEILSFAADAVADGWLNYTMYQATMPPEKMANGGYIGDQWVWIVDYEGSAYDLQMLLYGKSNIEMSEDRISPITLKPTKVNPINTTSPTKQEKPTQVVEESTTQSFSDEETTTSIEDTTIEEEDIIGEDPSNAIDNEPEETSTENLDNVQE